MTAPPASAGRPAMCRTHSRCVHECLRMRPAQRISGPPGHRLQRTGFPRSSFDPPGAGTRIIRITNVRADAAIYNVTPNPVLAIIAINSNFSMTFPGGVTSTQVEIGSTEKGMITKLAPGSTETIRVTEGYSLAWKYRNIENTLKNAAWSGTHYVYVSPDQNDPAQAAQNVRECSITPRMHFNGRTTARTLRPARSADRFRVRTFHPEPEIPTQFGRLRRRQHGDQRRRLSSSGTRIALSFQTLAPAVTVPSVVYLHPLASPSTTRA